MCILGTSVQWIAFDNLTATILAKKLSCLQFLLRIFLAEDDILYHNQRILKTVMSYNHG